MKSSMEKLAEMRMREKEDKVEDSDKEKLKALFNKFMNEEDAEEKYEDEENQEIEHDAEGGLSGFMQHKMEKMKGEDRPQAQKVAIAMSYARKAGFNVPKKK